MPVIHVAMWPGRTHAQKQELAKAITDAMVNIAKTTPRAKKAGQRSGSRSGMSADPLSATARQADALSFAWRTQSGIAGRAGRQACRVAA